MGVEAGLPKLNGKACTFPHRLHSTTCPTLQRAGHPIVKLCTGAEEEVPWPRYRPGDQRSQGFGTRRWLEGSFGKPKSG